LHLLGKFPFPVEKFCLLARDPALERIILLGDIFHNSHFNKIKENEQKFIEEIHRLQTTPNPIELVVIFGNHDKDQKKISEILGLPLQESYIWKTDRGNYLAVHGHQFYNFEKQLPFINKILPLVQEIVLRIIPSRAFHDWKNKIGRILLQKIITHIHKQARAYAQQFGAQAIFCGHIHFEELNTEENITYCNAGTWKDNPVPVVFVTQRGEISLEYR
jgi:UDP-2,3-diacylglucosamine pyrophosphatase LpxH